MVVNEVHGLVVVLAFPQVYQIVTLQMFWHFFVQTLVVLSLLSDILLVIHSGKVL